METVKQKLSRWRRTTIVFVAVAAVGIGTWLTDAYKLAKPIALGICHAFSGCVDRAEQVARYNAFSLGQLVAGEGVVQFFARATPEWRATVFKRLPPYGSNAHWEPIPPGASAAAWAAAGWLVNYENLTSALGLHFPYDVRTHDLFALAFFDDDRLRSNAAVQLRKLIQLRPWGESAAKQFDIGWRLRMILARASSGFYCAEVPESDKPPHFWLKVDDARTALAQMARDEGVNLPSKLARPANVEPGSNAAINFEIMQIAAGLQTLIDIRLTPTSDVETANSAAEK